MDYNKVEDAVLKKAMEFFKDNAVKFFGIDTRIIAPAETEIKTSYTDYLFYTEDGNYLHFEFQTTNKMEDLKRFLYYDRISKEKDFAEYYLLGTLISTVIVIVCSVII